MALYLDGQKIVNSLVIDGELANLTTKSITTNGTYNAEDDNASGYSSVSVNTPEAVKTLVYELGAGGRWETFTNPNAELLLVEVFDNNGNLFATHPLSATTIGNLAVYQSFTTFYPTFDGGKKLNLSRTNDSATIYISVNEGTSYSVKVYSLEASETVDLATKSITANGTYNASSDDLDGYSSVTVDVEGGSPLKLNSGKLNASGQVIADSDYYYTDEIDFPNGSMVFDFGATNVNNTGVFMYQSDGTFVDYYSPSERYRKVNTSSFYTQGVRKMRLSISKTYLSSVFLLDYVNEKMYSGAPENSGVVATKSITANGTYLASSDSVDGYSSVTVNVPNKIPVVVSGQSINIDSNDTITYTFTESGTFQYCGMLKTTDVKYTDSEITISLNGTPLTPDTLEAASTWMIFYYGEITVSSGDVLTMVRSTSHTNSGMQLFILKSTDLSALSFINFASNNNTTFAIDPTYMVLEVYYMGYYQTTNNFSYMVVSSVTTSIPTPNGQAYYYGGTYALRIG